MRLCECWLGCMCILMCLLAGLSVFVSLCLYKTKHEYKVQRLPGCTLCDSISSFANFPRKSAIKF